MGVGVGWGAIRFCVLSFDLTPPSDPRGRTPEGGRSAGWGALNENWHSGSQGLIWVAVPRICIQMTQWRYLLFARKLSMSSTSATDSLTPPPPLPAHCLKNIHYVWSQGTLFTLNLQRRSMTSFAGLYITGPVHFLFLHLPVPILLCSLSFIFLFRLAPSRLYTELNPAIQSPTKPL